MFFNRVMNKRVITVLVIAVAITGIAAGLSVPASAQQECGIIGVGEETSGDAKVGEGKEGGQGIAGLARQGNFGQTLSSEASHCGQNR
jgi:hypothetical protein